jgi:hypothetical protein
LKVKAAYYLVRLFSPLLGFSDLSHAEMISGTSGKWMAKTSSVVNSLGKIGESLARRLLVRSIPPNWA